MKIGAIGIRTKIIVGDAATWYLVKKYLDNVVIKNGGVTPEDKEKLDNYPQFPETPEGYYLADDGTFKALPDFVTDSEMIDYVGSEIAAGSVVIKEYVDQQDALKVDKVAGKGLSTEDYTTAEKSKVANVPLDTNAELGLKVDKVAGSSLVPDDDIITLQNTSGINTGDQDLSGLVEKINGHSLVPDTEIDKLAEYPTLSGDPTKFVSDDGTVKSISSIGVTGQEFYISTENSDIEGYKTLTQSQQSTETEIVLTAKSSDGIVWGAKYLSAPFTEAVTIPSTAYGFDYWRKVSAANGTSRKHLRVFLYRAGVETNITTPLASPDIEETEFTERQISYIFPELVLLAGDRIGIQEGFSTTHANNVTLTYIVGDGRGWFMRLPLPLKHANLTDKNSEAAVQHVDTNTVKSALDAADMVAIKDSVTGKVVLTPKSNLGGDNLIASYTHTGNKEVAVTAVDLATGVFTAVGHGFANGDRISAMFNVGSTTNIGVAHYLYPFGMNNETYYVVNSATDTFNISLTSGGAAVTFTNAKPYDLTKWHFERLNASNITFSQLPNLTNFIIRMNIKTLQTSYIYFLNDGGTMVNRIQDTIRNDVSPYHPTMNIPKSQWGMLNIEVNLSAVKCISWFGNTVSYIPSTGFYSIPAIHRFSSTNIAQNAITTMTLGLGGAIANGCVIQVYKI